MSDDLINGRTPKQIKHTLGWACFCCGSLDCDECKYKDVCNIENMDKVAPDALALIERLEAERDAMKTTLDRLGDFGKLFADYKGCPRGAVGHMGGVPIQEEVLAMKPIMDVDGGRWIPVNADALHELVEKYTALFDEDVVSVTRCKDCKNWGTGDSIETENVKICQFLRSMVHKREFCAFGEKKEGD